MTEQADDDETQTQTYQAATYVTPEAVHGTVFDLVSHSERDVRAQLENFGLPGSLVALATVKWYAHYAAPDDVEALDPGRTEPWNPKLDPIPDGADSLMCTARITTQSLSR